MFFYMSESSPFVRISIQKISNFIKRPNLTDQENKKGVMHFQTDHSFSVILHNSILTYRRISLCLFSKRQTKRGSMTLETALVLPLFLFAVLNLMSFVEIYRMQSNYNMQLHQTAKELAIVGNAVDVMGEDECIDLILPYRAKPFVGVVGFSDFWMFSRMRTRAWTGYDHAAAQKDVSEELVYMTEYGDVYHRSTSCAYLKLSIRAVDLEWVSKLRNKDGSCFYVCEECGKNCTNTVFVTSYGTRYHATLRCSKLTRKIREVKLSEVGGRTPCKKCS